MEAVCRCCLTEGFHKNMKAPYKFLDKKEIYLNMMVDCFNIVLMPMDLFTDAICDSCIKTLRASYNFKKMVLNSQEELMKKLNDVNSDIKAVKVKLEIEQGSGNESDDYFLADAVPRETLEHIKDEPIKNELEKRNGKKNIRNEAWKSERVKSLVNRLANSINSIDRPQTLKKRQKTLTIKPKALPKWISPQKQKYKHMDNLQTVLKYTNALPFKNKSLLGFICAYCDQAFPDPADLRNHAEEDHKEVRLTPKTNRDYHNNIKLDITDLKCTICDEKFKNLNEIKEHLVKTHKKVYHTDIKDFIVQYKLKKDDKNDCALCSCTYETFKMLTQHMNTHYPNFQCNKCDSAFSTKRSLHAHVTTHIESSFQCEHCDKVFSSRNKMYYHVSYKHLGERKISNCPYCDEPFKNYYQRNQHLINVHNTESQYKCNVCNKSFVLKSLLMYHIKRNHLMERDAQCSECGYRFFSKKALKAHMVKHTGERKYACEICHKSYGRKNTLREHMRIHNNDRRFKCDVCAMTFVQKCSLKSHLLSNHGINLASSEISSS